MERIAVMQPYFVPYGGYFRLFEKADLFVIYDCVQFPRRGYVHRNRLPDALGRPQWLTLPLASAPRDTSIADIAFADDSIARLAAGRRRFPCLADLPGEWEHLFATAAGPLVPWLKDTLTLAARAFGAERPMVRSSSLRIPPGIRGQDRIIEICRRLGARSYVNAPGGRALYDPQAFAAHGIELSFLPAYEGCRLSILHRLAAVAQERPA